MDELLQEGAIVNCLLSQRVPAESARANTSNGDMAVPGVAGQTPNGEHRNLVVSNLTWTARTLSRPCSKLIGFRRVGLLPGGGELHALWQKDNLEMHQRYMSSTGQSREQSSVLPAWWSESVDLDRARGACLALLRTNGQWDRSPRNLRYRNTASER